jgi:hypothetical protein
MKTVPVASTRGLPLHSRPLANSLFPRSLCKNLALLCFLRPVPPKTWPRSAIAPAALVYAVVSRLSKHTHKPAIPSPHVFFRFAASLFAISPSNFSPSSHSLLLPFVPRVRHVHLRPNVPRPASRCCHCAAHSSSYCYHDFPARPRRFGARLVPSGLEFAVRQTHFPERSRPPHHGQWRRSHAGMVTAFSIFFADVCCK